MRHRISGRKFNRRSSQRKALFIGLAKSLLKYEQIVTTLPKAKDLRPYVEKMITLGKKDSVARRRNLFAKLRDNALVSKVFGPLAERYADRAGGYTRIVKCGFRQGDAAPMAVIELVDRDVTAKGEKVVDKAYEKEIEKAKPVKASDKNSAPEVEEQSEIIEEEKALKEVVTPSKETDKESAEDKAEKLEEDKS